MGELCSLQRTPIFSGRLAFVKAYPINTIVFDWMNRSTALHISAQYGHTDIVKFLLAEGAVIPERHGALIEYEDEAVRGVSALYMASQEGEC